MAFFCQEAETHTNPSIGGALCCKSGLLWGFLCLSLHLHGKNCSSIYAPWRGIEVWDRRDTWKIIRSPLLQKGEKEQRFWTQTLPAKEQEKMDTSPTDIINKHLKWLTQNHYRLTKTLKIHSSAYFTLTQPIKCHLCQASILSAIGFIRHKTPESRPKRLSLLVLAFPKFLFHIKNFRSTP